MLKSQKNLQDDPHSCSDKPKRNVIVTGFGPFFGHSVNASWESVKLLPNIFEDDSINLIVEEIPVTYCAIEETIPKLWKEYDPIFVIHAGVSSLANNLTIERCAKLKGYNRRDVDGQIPCGEACKFGLEEVLHSKVDVIDLCTQMNDMKSNVKTSISTDAGSYCCEYIYYTSLCHGEGRCLFVHVPQLGKPYQAEEIAQGLNNILRIVLDQLSSNKVLENTL
ncbi:pyroglutamyl-peptidase 1 [Nilaparvata lugens]|uniref:pyroglutamyl-peptidase 1 n=1 Tax=Nilaparvata lugens TaxID=108931 RepID=UPI00193EB8AF|nr:pyroglutamyl-peptidase 1 [Nilaparvata lugens]